MAKKKKEKETQSETITEDKEVKVEVEEEVKEEKKKKKSSKKKEEKSETEIVEEVKEDVDEAEVIVDDDKKAKKKSIKKKSSKKTSKKTAKKTSNKKTTSKKKSDDIKDTPEGATSKEGQKNKANKKRRKRPNRFEEEITPEMVDKAKELVEKFDNATELREKRDDYNNRTKNLVNERRKIDEELRNNRDRASEYRAKRDSFNEEVAKYKEEKNALYDKMKILSNELKDLKQNEDDKKTSEKVETKKRGPSPRQLNAKINALEKKIITETLDLKQENEIILEIQELEKLKADAETKTGGNSEVKLKHREISNLRSEINKINNEIQGISEESQNYHVLMLELYKENDQKKVELEQINRDLVESKVIADEFHNKYREISANTRSKKFSRRGGSYSQQKRIKKEVTAQNLNSALDKKKKGKKLNIFEARALFENSSNDKQ